MVFALILFAQMSVGTDGRLKYDYNRFKDRARLQSVNDGTMDGCDLKFAIVADARGEAFEAPSISLMFTSQSAHWRFLESHEINMLVDGKRLSLPGTQTGAILDDGGGVVEVVGADVTAHLAALATAKKIELEIGNAAECLLTEENLAAIRDVAQRIPPVARKTRRGK